MKVYKNLLIIGVNLLFLSYSAFANQTSLVDSVKPICKGDSVILKAKSYATTNALSFDGADDYITVPHSSSLGLTSKGTIECWLKPKSLTQDVYATIVGKANGGNVPNISYFIEWYQGKLHCGISNGSAINNVDVPPLPDTNWHHLAFVWDSTNLFLYIDGKQVGSPVKQTISAQVNTSFNLKIGGYGWESNGMNSQEFFGLMDELRIWNVGRSAKEIVANMNLEIKGNYNGLVGYWKMDEGTGTTTADSSGNGNKGTLVNSPKWEVPSTTPLYSLTPSGKFLWDNGSTTASIKVNPTTTTTYTLTYTDNTNKTSTDKVIVTVNNLPAKPVVSEISDSLVSSDASSYQWYNSSSVLNGDTKKSYAPKQSDDYYVEIADTNGCKIKSDKIKFIFVNVTEKAFEQNLEVYPNPAGDYLLINADKNSKANIYNLNGQLIKSYKLENVSNNLNISDLKAGVYSIEIINKNIKTTKFVKNIKL